MPASTPPSEPASGVPASRVCSSASSRAWSRSRRAAAFSSEPRASGAIRAQAPCAARAPPTASCASGAPPAGTHPIASPVAGSRTASSGARCLTRKSRICPSPPCLPAYPRSGGRTLVESPLRLSIQNFKFVAQVTKTPARRPRVMTNERTQAYGRVVQTLDELGPTKLQPSEQARIREAADVLIFAVDLEEASNALRDMGALAE